jgi:sec-independent protein translocase protein TatC
MYLLKKVFELREKAHSDHEKPFLEHLEDLRVMITRVVITLLISMIVCFTFQSQLMHILREPAEKVIFDKQQETMPDEDAHPGIKVPTVETWGEAKRVERAVASLDEEQRVLFFKDLGTPDIEFHARSVALLRAAKALPENKRVSFVKGLGVEKEMVVQLLALVDSDPDVDASVGSNIKMMSALKPTEPFILSMKLAFFAGIVLAFPLLLMFVLQFVLPGLHEKERKILWPAMAVGFGLFLGGVLFAYFFVLPRALLFFFDWGAKLGVSNDWRIGEYITFATQFTLLFGLSFELPVVVMVLVKLGLLTYDSMAKTRTYAIVAIYIAAAIITPTPDIMTLNLMALPMIVLYEICIWLAWFDRKKEREAAELEEAELKKRRLEWMLNNDDREEAAGTGDSEDESVPEPGDDGWQNDYGHPSDEYDIEGDEDWVNPEDSITDESGDETKPKNDGTPRD